MYPLNFIFLLCKMRIKIVLSNKDIVKIKRDNVNAYKVLSIVPNM